MWSSKCIVDLHVSSSSSFFILLPQVLGLRFCCPKMGSCSLLFITTIVCLFSLESSIQTSHSLDNSESVQHTRSTGRNYDITSMASFYSETSSDSVEGSGLALHQLRAHDRGADKANISKTGHTHSSVHIISEETSLGGSHMTTEEQLKDSHTSIVKDDSQDGK